LPNTPRERKKWLTKDKRRQAPQISLHGWSGSSTTSSRSARGSLITIFTLTSQRKYIIFINHLLNFDMNKMCKLDEGGKLIDKRRQITEKMSNTPLSSIHGGSSQRN